jgi:hypothetical protein
LEHEKYPDIRGADYYKLYLENPPLDIDSTLNNIRNRIHFIKKAKEEGLKDKDIQSILENLNKKSKKINQKN